MGWEIWGLLWLILICCYVPQAINNGHQRSWINFHSLLAKDLSIGKCLSLVLLDSPSLPSPWLSYIGCSPLGLLLFRSETVQTEGRVVLFSLCLQSLLILWSTGGGCHRLRPDQWADVVSAKWLLEGAEASSSSSHTTVRTDLVKM